MSSDDVSETEMSQPLASGGLMSLTSAASAWWVSGVRGEGEFGSVLRQSLCSFGVACGIYCM